MFAYGSVRSSVAHTITTTLSILLYVGNRQAVRQAHGRTELVFKPMVAHAKGRNIEGKQAISGRASSVYSSGG